MTRTEAEIQIALRSIRSHERKLSYEFFPNEMRFSKNTIDP